MELDGNKLRRARERLGYSLGVVGGVAGLSKNSVLRAEHEEDIRPGTARKIAEALGVEVAELLPDPKVPGPAQQLESEEQRGADEERRYREENAEALMGMWIEEGEHLEEMIKSSPDGFPIRRAHLFSLGHSLARGFYEEIESTRQPSRALQEAKNRLDELNARIGSLWQQTMHPESGDTLDEFKRFAMRRAEAGHREVDEEGAHSAPRASESSA